VNELKWLAEIGRMASQDNWDAEESDLLVSNNRDAEESDLLVSNNRDAEESDLLVSNNRDAEESDLLVRARRCPARQGRKMRGPGDLTEVSGPPGLPSSTVARRCAFGSGRHLATRWPDTRTGFLAAVMAPVRPGLGFGGRTR
jgi:hypothetical protein